MFKCKFSPNYSVALPPSPPHTLHHSSNHVTSLGRWSTSGRGGQRIIFCHYKNTIEGVGEKESKRTNTNKTLGVNKEQKELCNTTCICRLTLAWVTSENSTKQLECRDLDSIFFAGPYLLLLCPESTASLRSSTPTLLLSRRQLALSSFFPNQLFRVPLPLPDTARFQVQKSFVWFRAKTDKGIVCLAGHPYSVTIHSPVGWD